MGSYHSTATVLYGFDHVPDYNLYLLPDEFSSGNTVQQSGKAVRGSGTGAE